MNENTLLESETMSVISNCDDIKSLSLEIISFLKTYKSPGDVLSELNNIQKNIKHISMATSLVTKGLKQLIEIYKLNIKSFYDKRYALLEKVNIRKSNDTQLNTMGSLSGDNELYEISINGVGQPELNGKLSDYSLLSIVSKLESSELSILQTLEEKIKYSLESSFQFFLELKGKILQLDIIVSTPKIASILSAQSNTEEVDRVIKSLIKAFNGFQYRSNASAKAIKNIFQCFSAEAHNLEVYERGIDTLCQTVLESYFNDSGVIEFC